MLKELEKQYQSTLKDIDIKIRLLESDDMTQSRIYRLEYQKTLKKQVEATLEKLHSDEYSTIKQFLSDTYTNGFVGTMYDLHGQGIPLLIPIDKNAAAKAIISDTKLNKELYESLGIDINKMKKTISNEITRGIAGGFTHDEIARNISFASNAPLSRAKTIAKTESHRIQQASTYDAQKAAKGKGADIVKQWDSTLDGKTRSTHRQLDGQIREIDEPFELDGKKAMFPGDFGDPAEDCNCRCSSLQRARKALDADELSALKERAAYFGLDKTDSLNDFKKKYIDGAEQVRASESTEHSVINRYGQTVVFDKRLDAEKWSDSVSIIKNLVDEYDTRLTTVGVGANGAAGSVDMGGAMKLSSTSKNTAIHEFAHSVATEALTKYGVVDDSDFWKEIKSVRRAYRKDVGEDTARWISSYEHSAKAVDEFYAEAFTHAKMKQMGISIPSNYGNDFTYSEKVLEITDKYFKKTVENTTKSGIMKTGTNVVKEAVNSGKVSTVVNPDKQNRHIKGSTGYIEGRSYINGTLEDTQKLVEDLSGTGTPVIVNGEWKHKERVVSDHEIGVFIDPDTKEETTTKSGMIHYSKTGSHIVPRKDEST